MVAESIRSGIPKGYEMSDVAKPKTEAEARCEKLAEQVSHSHICDMWIFESEGYVLL